MTTPSGGLVGDGVIRIRADTDEADRAIRAFADTSERALNGIVTAARPLAGVGAALGSAVPVAAGLAAAVGNIAPAATAAATGFVAIQLAAGALQLAMVGVEDAITAAFDTGEGSAEAFQESLEGLAPSAQEFVIELRSMRDELSAVQQSVQQRFFEGFATELEELSVAVLPAFRDGLNTTATTLNQIAIGVSDAAQELAADGTLGQAIDGANQSLLNLRDVPAQVVTAFGQLAAAGAPALDRLTQAAADAADSISERLTGAVESGALEDAVDRAVDLLFSLGPIAADVFGILQNLFEAAAVGGEDLFQVLGSIFDALNQFTGTETFQEALTSLVETMSVVGDTAAPLLISALQAVAPVFTAIAGPVQTLVSALGTALEPVIESLGPLLTSTAEALGALLVAISPFLEGLGQIVALIGDALVPVIDLLAQNFALITPLFEQAAQILINVFAPILAILPSFLDPITVALLELIEAILPTLTQLFTQLEPTLVQTTATFGQLLITLTPLIVAAINLATNILNLVLPALTSIIGVVARVSNAFNGFVNGVIQAVFIPALRAITALLTGDFSAAFTAARNLVSRVLNAIGGFFRSLVNTVTTALRNVVSAVSNQISRIVNFFQNLPGRVASALSGFASRLSGIIRDAGQRAVDAASNRIGRIVEIIAGLPRRAANAIGNLSNTLYNAGRELIQGFIDGIQSLIGAVSDTVSGLVDTVTGWLPGSPAERGPLSGQGYTLFRGERFTEDFARGIEMPENLVRNASRGLAAASVEGLADAPRPNLPIVLSDTSVDALAPGAIPGQVVINLSNNGVIGSRTELLNWLTQSLDHLARLNRLPSNRSVRS